MKITVSDEKALAGQYAASEVATVLNEHPRAALGVATGSSPLALYQALSGLVRTGHIDFSHREAFALDEYVGLSPNHPQSYHAVIAREVTQPLGLSPGNVHLPAGTGADLATAAEEFERSVLAVPTRVQIVGIGENGHIGFNEPGSSRLSRTRVVALTEATRSANSRFFTNIRAVPTHAVTQGIATIMRASTIILVANGAAKAPAIAAALEGPQSETIPASILQTHPDVRVFLDTAAASQLHNRSLTRPGR